jgi:hypothetical protein
MPPHARLHLPGGAAPEIIDVRQGRLPKRAARDDDSSTWGTASTSESIANEIREDEEEELCVVDFAAETKEGDDDGRGISDLLRRFTYIEDAASESIKKVRKAMEVTSMWRIDESDSDSSSA